MPIDQIKHFNSHQEMSSAASQTICQAMEEAIEMRGICHMVLSGGSSNRLLYKLLSRCFSSLTIDPTWHSVNLFPGEERLLASGHPESNMTTIKSSLIANIPQFSGTLNFPKMNRQDPVQLAIHYEHLLKTFFPEKVNSAMFDIVVLGIDAQGNIASLSPQFDLRQPNYQWVLPVTDPGLGLAHVTLSPTILNASRLVILLMSAISGQRIVRKILERSPDCTASLIQAKYGKTLYYLVENKG